jgi:hypothetical protein
MQSLEICTFDILLMCSEAPITAHLLLKWLLKHPPAEYMIVELSVSCFDSPIQYILEPTITIALIPGNLNDIMSPDFFNYAFYFQKNKGDLTYPSTRDLQPMSTWINNGTKPRLIGLLVDGFAKYFYSIALVDLGQTTGPNALTNATALQYLLQQENNTVLFPWQPTSIQGLPTDKIYQHCLIKQAIKNSTCNNLSTVCVLGSRTEKCWVTIRLGPYCRPGLSLGSVPPTANGSNLLGKQEGPILE